MGRRRKSTIAQIPVIEKEIIYIEDLNEVYRKCAGSETRVRLAKLINMFNIPIYKHSATGRRMISIDNLEKLGKKLVSYGTKKMGKNCYPIERGFFILECVMKCEELKLCVQRNIPREDTLEETEQEITKNQWLKIVDTNKKNNKKKYENYCALVNTLDIPAIIDKKVSRIQLAI